MGKNILSSWEKKLLDIGKRNQLVNYRGRVSSTIEFYHTNIYSFFDEFTSDKQFILAKLFKNLDENITMSDFDEDTIDEFEVKERVTNALGVMIDKKDKYEPIEIEEIIERFKPLKNKNYLYPLSIYSRAYLALDLLRRKSKLLREENGIESLYMCFGFVDYVEQKEHYLAPIALIPCEISRKHLSDEETIKALDDEFLVNENFCYYAKLNYNVDLHKSSPDLSLSEYINEVMTKLKDTNSSFKDTVALGIFSFSKIMMYNDLANNEEKILSNKWIRLFAGYKNNDIDNTIDTKFVEEPIFNQNQVLPCDSSQYMAIYYAKQNKSFVLQGPPGTGKSQTITNILAELIGQGKKVLFVCEKSSALDVVYNNLKKCNLDMYALPIYDTKANKKEIVRDIYKNIEYLENHNVRLSDEGKKKIDKVEDMKYFFDSYLEKLNSKTNLGLTLDELINLSSQNYEPLDFKIDNIKDIDKVEYNEILNNIALLSLELDKLNSAPINHPFNGFKLNKATKADLSKILSSTNDSLNLLDKIYKTYIRLNTLLFAPRDIRELVDYSNLLSYSHNKFNLSYSDFLHKNLVRDLDSLDKVEELYSKINKEKSYLLKKYVPQFLDIDISLDLADLKDKYNNPIKRVFGYNKLSNKYEAHLIIKRELEYKELLDDLTRLESLKNNYNYLSLNEAILYKDFSKMYFGAKTEFKKLRDFISYLHNVSTTLDKLNIENKTDIYNLLIQNENYDLESKSLLNLSESLNRTIEPLYDYFEYDTLNTDIPSLIMKLKNISLDIDSIYSYLDFKKALDKLPKSLNDLKRVIISKKIDSESFKDQFVTSFAKYYLDDLYDSDSSLSDLTDSYMNYSLNEYKKYNEELYSISKVKISDKVTASWPQINGLSGANIEVKTLRNEMNKKRKLMSVRELFSHMPHLLMSLKPIFMMSPLAVSNYLDSDAFHFDCVIFDEASQITTENAVGSIYRANQLIIVGDKEQLPPTSFFDSVDIEEDDDYLVYESVLDEASSILPNIMLKWHYRSRDESLITYSNKEIYKNLVTFPASEINSDLGLRYEAADGVYEHNKRINLIEAKKVVDLVFYSFRHNPNKSIGVVTFNMSQEALINRLINQRRREDSAYESFFDETIKEPFFIKNLETVQGDERDIIILSTTFGPDKDNKQSMNFGPINKDGGYRRLNVAITRAKEMLIVVSSLDTTRFNYDNINSRGVRMLGGFLDFAKGRNVDSFVEDLNVEPFTKKLSNEFKKRGYNVVEGLGANDFKVDLGIVDFKDSKKLIAGILVDAKSYKNLASNKDRNIVIDNVLSLRGWKLFHVYKLTSLNNISSIVDNIIEHLGETNTHIEEVEENNISEAKEAEILDVKSLFDTYPNVISIIDEEIHKNISLSDKIMNIVNKISPVSKSELIRLLSTALYGSLTKDSEKEINDSILYLKESKKVYIIVGFIIKPSDLLGLRFRRFDSLNPYNRTIDNVYIEELEEGFKTILMYVKQTSKDTLFKTFNDLLGYPTDSKKTIDTFKKVLAVLEDKHDIELIGDVVSFI